jgi:flagellar hook-associated protein 2
MRVSGLASGMDTESIVKNLVQVQSARLDKLTQSKTLATWKSDAYRDVNKKVDEFRKAMEGLRLNSTFNKQAVTSSDSRVAVSSATTSSRTDFQISQATLATSAKPAMVSFNSAGAGVGTTGFTFNLNGTDIALQSGQTLDQAITAINNASSQTNVKASNVGGSLVLTSIGTGSSATIEITNAPVDNPLGLTNQTYVGADAQSGSVTINGTQIAISSNKFTYEGVTFDLKGNISTTDTPVGVQVGSDTEAVFNSIKTFVDKYNELIEDFNGKITEKKYRDFPPLSDEQKKEMSDSEVELWEEKAKSGMLTNDSTIRSFLTEMRNSLSAMVQTTGEFNSLRDIGINFSTNYRDHGKLVLDENKLKGVLQTNLADVRTLFSGKGTNTDTSATTVTDRAMHDNSGFGWRIYDRVNLAIKQLGTLAGSPNSTVDTQSFMAKQIKNLDASIDKETQKVRAYEERMWRQFTAMEKALSQMNSQSSWLYQQMGL